MSALKLPSTVWVTLLSICFAWVSLPHAYANSGFSWDKWANALNEDPCKWLPAEQIAELLEGQHSMHATNTASESRCQWTSADGKPLLSIAIKSLKSAADVNNEKNSQLQQIKDYGTSRFDMVGKTTGVTTAVLRKDRLWLSIFANSEKESAYIVLSGHPIMGETPEQKKLRRERLVKVAKAIDSRFDFGGGL